MSAKALFAFFAIMHGVQAQTSPPDGVVEVVLLERVFLERSHLACAQTPSEDLAGRR